MTRLISAVMVVTLVLSVAPVLAGDGARRPHSPRLGSTGRHHRRGALAWRREYCGRAAKMNAPRSKLRGINEVLRPENLKT